MVSRINYARDPLECEAAVAGLSGMDVQPMLLLTRPKLIAATDSLPEWSKGVDSSSTSANCVGSNPTAVILAMCDSTPVIMLSGAASQPLEVARVSKSLTGVAAELLARAPRQGSH